MPGLGRWETVWILQSFLGIEVGRLLRNHLGRDLAADMVHQAEMLIGMVHGEEQIRGVELEEHASDGPEVRRKGPTILEEDLRSAVLPGLDQRLMLATGRGAACATKINDLDPGAITGVQLEEDVRKLEIRMDQVIPIQARRGGGQRIPSGDEGGSQRERTCA